VIYSEFADRLSPFVKNLIVLKGGMGQKQRRETAEKLKGIPMCLPDSADTIFQKSVSDKTNVNTVGFHPCVCQPLDTQNLRYKDSFA